MATLLHQNNFATNLTSATSATDTTSPLDSIPTIDAPFYIAFDATNINGHYEALLCTSKTATNVNHAALSYDHTTAEEVRMVVPAAELDNLATISTQASGNWVSYTPTPTNFTVGNGQLVAAYSQVGKTVEVRVKFLLGNTSAVSGAIGFTLPTTSITYPGTAATQQLGEATFLDSGTAVYFGPVLWATTTTVSIQVFGTAATYLGGAATSNLVPMTWTTNDEFSAIFTYQAA